MNVTAIRAIYKFEMSRTRRTLMQSIIAPVISTALYFVVSARRSAAHIRSRGRHLRRLHRPGARHAVASDARASSNASRHLLPKFTGTIYELSRRRCPIRDRRELRGGGSDQVVASASSSSRRSLWCRCVSSFGLSSVRPGDLQPRRFHHRHLGGRFPRSSRPYALIITPLTFLGGSFYSIDMLPPFWQTVSLFNPVVYLVRVFAGASTPR